MRLVLLVRSLGVGGTERQVLQLANDLQADGVAVTVVSLYAIDCEDSLFLPRGVALVSTARRGRWETFAWLIRTVRLLRKLKPDVIYSFLPVANLAAVMVRPFLGRVGIVWGVRASQLRTSLYGRFERIVISAERRLARLADCTIVNSERGRADFVAAGATPRKLVLIPNGIDTALFSFDACGRERVRAEWRIGGEHLLIGLVARLDPTKGHDAFLNAARQLRDMCPAARFVCVGSGPEATRTHLERSARELGLEDSVLWVESRRDMPDIYSALDVACSSSISEGFSNVIAEAMSCSRPCVATDVGDSLHILGDTGVVVPASDPAAMAAGLARLLLMDEATRAREGRRSRDRIALIASRESCVTATLRTLRDVGRGSTSG